ncbi:MAG: hypothetical protein R6X08_12215 [Desulfosalsimonadaceae bacterium]
MKNWLLLPVLLSGLFFCLPAAGSQAILTVCTPDEAPAGSRAWINWTGFTICATGRGEGQSLGQRCYDPYKAMARARQRAYRVLLQTAKSVRLTAVKSVGAFLQNNDRLLARFENLVKKAEVTNREFLSTGPVELTLELSMTGEFASMVLPDTVTRLEAIESSQPPADKDGSSYTGLLVDARGLSVSPSMCFQLLDEEGEEVYGPAYSSREHVIEAGMCRYVAGISRAKDDPRIGDNPLMIKGIRLRRPGGTDIIISDTDASRLRGEVEHLAFLRRCRVIVVMDAATRN